MKELKTFAPQLKQYAIKELKHFIDLLVKEENLTEKSLQIFPKNQPAYKHTIAMLQNLKDMFNNLLNFIEKVDLNSKDTEMKLKNYFSSILKETNIAIRDKSVIFPVKVILEGVFQRLKRLGNLLQAI
ncbi:MAG: hypothetical protein QW625_01565 [Candidatus Nanoarchaeia archaeon]